MILLTKNPKFSNIFILVDDKINTDLVVIFFLYATMIVDLFRNLNDGFLHLPIASNDIVRNIIYIITFLYIIIHALINKSLLGFVGISLGFAVILIFSLIINLQIISLIPETVLLFYARCICGFYFAFHINRFDKLLNSMQKYCFIAVIYLVIMILFNREYMINYMPISYNLVLPFFAALFGFIINRKKLFLIPTVIIFGYIVLYGARAPLVYICVASFLFFVFQFKDMNLNKKLIYIFLGAIVLLVFLISFEFLLAQLMLRYPESRSLALLSQGRLLSFEGRGIFYGNAIKIIMENPLKIRGILSDRVIFSNILNVEISTGYYTHNILLEILLEYGVLLGSVIIIYISYITIIAFRYVNKVMDSNIKALFCIFVGYVITSLMVSGSYVTDYLFWFFMGLMLNINYNIIRQRGKITYETNALTKN